MPTAQTPNLGKVTGVGLALQAASGTYLAPTHWLKHRDGLPIMPDYVRATDDYATGHLYTNPTEISGITYEGKTETASAEATGLGLASHAMFGTSAAAVTAITAQTVTLTAAAIAGATTLTVTALTAALPAYVHLRFGGVNVITSAAAASGATSVTVYPLPAGLNSGASAAVVAGQVITPRAAENWDPFMPGRAVSVVRRGTAGGLRVTDAQISELQLSTSGQEQPLTAQYTIHGLLPEVVALNTLPSPVVTGAPSFNLADTVLLNGGVLPRAESAQLTIGSGVSLLPATLGSGLYRSGFERTPEGHYARGTFTLSAPDANFVSGYTTNTRGPIVVGVMRGSTFWRVICPSAEIRTYTEQTGLDRNTVNVEWTAVSPDGTPNFMIHTSVVVP